MVGNRGTNIVNLVIGVATIGAVVAGVVFITGAMNRKRQKLMRSFVGFNRSYWKKFPANDLGSPHQLKEIADKLYSAVGYVNDDEEAIYSALRQARTVQRLSYISDQFYIRHGGRSLSAYLTDYMDRRGETKQIIQILKNLEQ